MTETVKYEWGVVEFEGCEECWHNIKTTFYEDFDYILDIPLSGDSKVFLVRSVFNGDGEMIDRQYAYVTNSGLPREFDGGSRVPQKHRDQVNAVEEI